MGSREGGDKERQAEKRWRASDRVLRVSEDGDGDGIGAGAQKGVGWSCGETERGREVKGRWRKKDMGGWVGRTTSNVHQSLVTGEKT